MLILIVNVWGVLHKAYRVLCKCPHGVLHGAHHGVSHGVSRGVPYGAPYVVLYRVSYDTYYINPYNASHRNP